MADLGFYLTYRPMIANPWLSDKTYINIPSSPNLEPYIRCFWGSLQNFNPHTAPIYENMLVIPDTCFDIVFIQNNISGYIKILFTGLYDRHTFDNYDIADTDISIFAVRLNFWAMTFLSKYPLIGMLNQSISSEDIFPRIKDLGERIFAEQSFIERTNLATNYIAKMIEINNSSNTFLNCVDFILTKKGIGTLDELSQHACYSKRQVQRIFLNAVGITPKHLMNLVRYQFIWQEMLRHKNFDYITTAYNYNYVDQSHFIADFKRYHSLTPKEALQRILTERQ